MKLMIALIFTALLTSLSCGSGEIVTEETHSEEDPGPASVWSSVVVTGSVVNLRAGPGTQYQVLDQVSRGDTLQVTGGLEDWYRIYVRDRSLFAWIYAPLTSGTDLP